MGGSSILAICVSFIHTLTLKLKCGNENMSLTS